ncbi:MAG: EF-hand domain-containing protein [Magnetococcales bacterium]|nr:EF-hand domain-containing protein [Magnetococcales bacterium]
MIGSVTSGTMPQAVSGASKSTASLTQLFQQIDTGNTGSITKAQFEAAFQKMQGSSSTSSASSANPNATADAIWSKLDPNNTGSVSESNFVSGMQSVMPQAASKAHHHHHHSQSAGSSTSQASGGNQWSSPAATLDESLQSLLSTTASPSSTAS